MNNLYSQKKSCQEATLSDSQETFGSLFFVSKYLLKNWKYYGRLGAIRLSYYMSALSYVTFQIREYDMSKFDYHDHLTLDENRGAFLWSRTAQFMGYYIEAAIPEWDPDPISKHLGVGCKTDWENSTIVVEQKRNTATDNYSSRKANIKKLLESAEERGKIPIYAYWEDRKKNDYIKDGVRHLHGVAIFKYLGIEDQWGDFLSHTEDVKLIIKEELSKKFNEYYESSGKTSV